MNRQIIVNNSLVNYGVFDEANNKSGCLLFLHGWRSNKEVWGHVIAKLSGHQVFTIDLPGFGKSPAPKAAWTVGDYAETVAEFIKKLNLQNVIIVGHSFGGRVGIKVASRHPDIIGKLVLVDSAGFVTEQTKKRAMELGAKLVKPFFLPKFMQGTRRKIYKIIGADDYVATPWLTETFIKIKDEDLTEDMKKINCPTFIVFGENDAETPASFGEKMHALIAKSQLLIIKNAGHFSFLDRQDEFVKVLTEFLSHG